MRSSGFPALSGTVVGVVLALAGVAVFNILAGFTLSHDRLVHVARKALDKGELPYASRPREDYFTECALLEMEALRSRSVLLNAVETPFLFVANVHPCDSLRTLVEGTAAEQAELPKPVIYTDYAFGSRYLEAVVLSILDYRAATEFYTGLSYGSVVLLWLAMLWRSRRTALILLPIPILLLYAFGLHLFGHNPAHAPGFFVGFFALGGLVAAKGRFRRKRARWCFFGALGVLTAYFDMLTGAIPVILALSLVLNHYFYAETERTAGSYALSGIRQGLAIFACFLSGFVALTLARLGVLVAIGIGIDRYYRVLTYRLGNVVPGGVKVTFADVVDTLWNSRFQLTPGGAEPATWVLYAAAASWLFALICCPLAFLRGRAVAARLAADLMVLTAASAGIIAWYAVFPGHTTEHVLFIIRTIAIPAACCMTAAIAVTCVLVPTRASWVALPGAAVASAVLAAVLMAKPWDENLGATATLARFVDASADLVSCAALGLHPDGKPDGIVELRYRRAHSPAEILGFSHPKATNILLERYTPRGAWETGRHLYVLGLSDSMKGPLLNQPDGSFQSGKSGKIHLYAHFCRDGADTPESVYDIDIDGTIAQITPR